MPSKYVKASDYIKASDYYKASDCYKVSSYQKASKHIKASKFTVLESKYSETAPDLHDPAKPRAFFRDAACNAKRQCR